MGKKTPDSIFEWVQTARKYWNKLSQRLRDEGFEPVTNCNQLKMMTKDGKQTYKKPTIKNPNIIVGGNPARVIRKRFDDEFIELLEKFKWWDKSIDGINDLIPMLTNSNLNKVKESLRKNNK